MAEHRYEREIDELLRRIEGEHRAPLPFRRQRAAPWAAVWGRARVLLGLQSAVERLMLAAVVLLLVTFLLGLFAPRLAGPLGLLALLSFVAALGLSVWHGANGRGAAQGSRGQYYPAAGSSVDWGGLTWRLRRWLRRLRG